MKVITLAKTKELLGISVTTLDTQIERYIPIIDAKVKQITNNRYNMQILGDVTLDSKIVPISGLSNITGGIQNNMVLDDIDESIIIGSLISGTGIPDGSYIGDFYYNLSTISDSLQTTKAPVINLSADATATGASVVMYLGISIGLQPTVAKGIQWLINQENTDEPGLGWTSKRMGPVSVVRGVAQAAIDGRYGMPVWFVNAFPSYMGIH
ncbi:MAG: hypothetical protein PF693_10975 [Spirochaetia bacterium]|nr:hypothetical protein [Spirochaetia bacterium]